MQSRCTRLTITESILLMLLVPFLYELSNTSTEAILTDGLTVLGHKASMIEITDQLIPFKIQKKMSTKSVYVSVLQAEILAPVNFLVKNEQLILMKVVQHTIVSNDRVVAISQNHITILDIVSIVPHKTNKI